MKLLRIIGVSILTLMFVFYSIIILYRTLINAPELYTVIDKFCVVLSVVVFGFGLVSLTKVQTAANAESALKYRKHSRLAFILTMFLFTLYQLADILLCENPETWRVAASSIAATVFCLFFLLSLRALWLERLEEKRRKKKYIL